MVRLLGAGQMKLIIGRAFLVLEVLEIVARSIGRCIWGENPDVQHDLGA